MTPSLARLFAGLSAALIASMQLLAVDASRTPVSQTSELRADGCLKWYRGNMHTHSLWSDGDDYPEMIALWYCERDYDFLCFSDHNVLPTTERWIDVEKSKGGHKAYDKLKACFPNDWVEERTTDDRLEVRLKRFDEVAERLSRPGEFLLIQGEEITDHFRNLPVHLNATNIQELIPPLGGDSVYDVMQNNVNAVITQRERTREPILVHLNHPNYRYAVTAEDLMRVRGENFFEVYNGHPNVKNSGDEQHASTERIWDIILTWRLSELDLPIMYGLATDDGHYYHNIPSRASEPGRGWVVVLAAELTPEAIIRAMEAGRFYSSSGVELSAITATSSCISLEVAATANTSYTIEFVGTRRNYDSTREAVVDDNGRPVSTTMRYSDDVGTILRTVRGTAAAYRFAGDELYVRARVTSSTEHPNPSEPGEPERAWTQPVLGPAATSDAH